MTSRAVAIVVTTDKVIAAVILELLLDGQGVELSSKSELPINLLLADIEVLHVKESLKFVRFMFVLKGGGDKEMPNSIGGFILPTNFGNSMLKLFHQLLLAARLVELAEVEGDQVRPFDYPTSVS